MNVQHSIIKNIKQNIQKSRNKGLKNNKALNKLKKFIKKSSLLFIKNIVILIYPNYRKKLSCIPSLYKNYARMH